MIDFTKGKWAVDTSYSTMLLVSVEANIICQIDCDTYNFETSAVEPSDEEIANAHLIASAPDMYNHIQQDIEILQRECKNHVIGSYGLRHLLLRIKSKKVLLSKARGE